MQIEHHEHPRFSQYKNIQCPKSCPIPQNLYSFCPQGIMHKLFHQGPSESGCLYISVTPGNLFFLWKHSSLDLGFTWLSWLSLLEEPQTRAATAPVGTQDTGYPSLADCPNLFICLPRAVTLSALLAEQTSCGTCMLFQAWFTKPLCSIQRHLTPFR